MSEKYGKQFKYKNGYVGCVSDKVAEILAAKKQGEIIGDAPASQPRTEKKGK